MYKKGMIIKRNMLLIFRRVEAISNAPESNSAQKVTKLYPESRKNLKGIVWLLVPKGWNTNKTNKVTVEKSTARCKTTFLDAKSSFNHRLII
jgi:hypothetical protein